MARGWEKDEKRMTRRWQEDDKRMTRGWQEDDKRITRGWQEDDNETVHMKIEGTISFHMDFFFEDTYLLMSFHKWERYLLTWITKYWKS